jgi:hypothetical protein
VQGSDVAATKRKSLAFRAAPAKFAGTAHRESVSRLLAADGIYLTGVRQGKYGLICVII